MEELEAITLIKSGNLCGLEMLVGQYYFQAVRASYLIVQDRYQAEDIVQSAFLHAFEKISQLSSDRFGPWFLRIVVNASLKIANRQKKKISLDDVDEGDSHFFKAWLVDQQPLPEDLVETEELYRGVWQALRQLTANQRAVIVLKYYLEMSEDEITRELNTPKSTIKWRLFTARERLRDLLTPQRSSRPPSVIKSSDRCSEHKE